MKAFGVRPEARPRPELPDRLEPPRRDRARRGARPGRRRARGRRRPRRAERAPRRARRATSTSSSSTARSSRRCATRSTPHPNTTLHFADAVKLDLAALDPPPTKVVANLPYGVAATVILRTVAELPARDHLGRDGAEGGGGAASPREPGHGRLRRARRVLAQLACDVRVLRPVSRTVFHPVPNVDSVLVGPDPPRPGARAGAARARAARLRAPPQGARALARARARRRAGDPRPRARRAGGDRPPGRRARRAARAGRSGARARTRSSPR